jgi:hypothetical protein
LVGSSRAGEKRSKTWRAAAALAAHAVGDQAQRAPGYTRVHQQLDLVLLVGAVALVQAGRGRNAEALRGRVHGRQYKLCRCPHRACAMNESLHSPQRHLIELRMAHADLDQLIDAAGEQATIDELALKRLKKRRLMLRDQISLLEAELDPPEKA